ncbi:unnamed protein product [Vitrella brassicaformis CCMP3155]|uniref:Uncharacterized protein n=1 Tax=Vitrella brassicaformis (strain CCMP3155) TaxID=1169540 RepID=A0A0G4FKR8_VITBC|nr:unnamed protein product [Vitrella brassicaformis CCMP3155]|eukprot:CEM13942.1 unnamed protein product [Vitrella brassicaformis CCMP3155]
MEPKQLSLDEIKGVAAILTQYSPLVECLLRLPQQACIPLQEKLGVSEPSLNVLIQNIFPAVSSSRRERYEEAKTAKALPYTILSYPGDVCLECSGNLSYRKCMDVLIETPVGQLHGLAVLKVCTRNGCRSRHYQNFHTIPRSRDEGGQDEEADEKEDANGEEDDFDTSVFYQQQKRRLHLFPNDLQTIFGGFTGGKDQNGNQIELRHFMISTKRAFDTTMLDQLMLLQHTSQVSFYGFANAYLFQDCLEEEFVFGQVRRTGLSKGALRVHLTRAFTLYRLARFAERRLNRATVNACREHDSANTEMVKLIAPNSFVNIDMAVNISDFLDAYSLDFEELTAEHQCSHEHCSKVVIIDGGRKLTIPRCATEGLSELYSKELGRSMLLPCLGRPVSGSKLCEDCLIAIEMSRLQLNDADVDEDGMARRVERLTSKQCRVAEDGTQELFYDVILKDQTTVKGVSMEELIDRSKYVGGWYALNEFRTSTTTSKAKPRAHTSRSWQVSSVKRGKRSESDASKRRRTGSPGRRGSADDSLVHLSSQLAGIDKTTNLTGCRTDKESTDTNKATAGILVAMRPCGEVLGFSMMAASESLTQAHFLCAEIKRRHPEVECVCYDNGCMMAAYAKNQAEAAYATEMTHVLAGLKYCLDRLHVYNHQEKCQETFGPDRDELKDIMQNVDTQVCERLFSWLNGFNDSWCHLTWDHLTLLLFEHMRMHCLFRRRGW